MREITAIACEYVCTLCAHCFGHGSIGSVYRFDVVVVVVHKNRFLFRSLAGGVDTVPERERGKERENMLRKARECVLFWGTREEGRERVM